MLILKRLKNLVVSLALAGGLWTAPILAAGTTPLSMVQQFDQTGQPLAGCLLYFFVAGTVATPQNAFSDFGLTSTTSNPLTCDQSGRIPQHWLADGLIHIRLTDSSGLPIIDTTMQVLGPSSGGGGGGGTVDPTTIMATGDIKGRYGTGVLSGFVRANGLTIGNVTCGCTERSNNDTQALFIYLYTTDPNLVVSGGRTGNALNDFNASKQLTLPDGRGRALAGLDDMGNSPAGRLTATYFGASGPCSGVLGTLLGAACGGESHTLTIAELAAHSHANTLTDPGHFHHLSPGTSFTGLQGGGAAYLLPRTNNGTDNSVTTDAVVTGMSINNASAGSGTAHAVVQPTMLITTYIKL